MKIVYMGTPDFAVNPLHALAEAGYEVTGIETWVPGLPACEGTRSGIFTGS